MTLEKQLLLPINLGRVIRPYPNYLESIILERERDYSPVENIEDSCQSTQEWTSQQVHPKVRVCNAQKNCKKPKSYISEKD